MRVTLLLLGIIPILVTGQPQVKNLEEYESCVERWLKKDPKLGGRFKRSQVAWLCERSDAWIKESAKPTTLADDIITNNQRKWLQGVRKCAGNSCFQEAIKQRCRGRRCVKRQGPVRPDRKQRPKKLRPRPTPKAEEEFDKSRLTKPVNITEALQELDPETLGQKESILTLDLEDLVKGPGSFCQAKRQLAVICPRLAAAENAFADELNKLTGDEKEQMRSKVGNLKIKCQSILNSFPLDQSFETLDDCTVEQKRTQKKKQIANDCVRIMGAGSAAAAFPDLQGKEQKTKYQEKSQLCQTLQNLLVQNGLSFQRWQRGSRSGSSRRRPRPRSRERSRDSKRVRRQAIDWDDPTLEFDDIDNIDFRLERKEYRSLTDDERQRFHDAINGLKTDLIDGISKYDLLVIYHTPQESPGAHWGAAFLPFHRELLKQFEVALREIDPEVSVPYWDSTLDEGLPEPRDSILWTEEFLGNGDGQVVTGPFANWDATHELSTIPGMRKLYRDVGVSPYGGLYKEADFEFAVSREIYHQLTACIDPTFELIHGLAHMFVGGYFADLPISPNDPVFFLHHSFVDFMWEEFRLLQQTEEQRQLDYPTDDESCSSFHFGANQMRPFSLTNKDGLSNNYTRDLYIYYPRPTCDEEIPDCASPYLFCDIRNFRCLSKVQLGGNCSNFEHSDICYEGICSSFGICIPLEDMDTTTTTTTMTPTITTTTGMPITTTTTAKTTTTTTTTEPPITRVDPVTTPKITTTTSTKPPTTTSTIISTEPDTTTTTTTTSTPTTTTTTATTTIITITRVDDPDTTTTTTQQPATTSTTTQQPVTTTTTTQQPVTTTTTTQQPVTTTTTTQQPVTTTTTRAEPPITTTTISPTPILTTTAGDIPVVYFSVTIIRGSYNLYRIPVPGARIRSVGLNVPTGYTQVLSGSTYLATSFPHYSGAAVVPVMDPEMAGFFPLVQAGIEVFNEMGRPCKAHCFQATSESYIPCSSNVRVSTNSYHSDPIEFRKSKREALEALWTSQGPTRTRLHDYLMFQC